MWERTESKWRGAGWFFLAVVAIVVALGMQLSDVPAGGVRGAASCEDVVDGGDRYSYAASQGCERAIGDRGSMAIAMLAIAGFLVAAGVRRVRRRPNDRTVVGLLLFAVAAALLLWPVNSDVQGARCGSPLLTASDDLYFSGDYDESDDSPSPAYQLAGCGKDQSSRLAWAVVWAAAGTLMLASRRREQDRDAAASDDVPAEQSS